jgi:hypothetical protein
MSPRTAPLGAFQKVGECLYRYSNGVYYARLKVNGKEIRRSLRTSDRDMAKRELARLREEQKHIDRSQGKFTLGELCARFLKTRASSVCGRGAARDYGICAFSCHCGIAARHCEIFSRA